MRPARHARWTPRLSAASKVSPPTGIAVRFGGGRALARILAGGALPHRTTVSEDYILDLEREAFVRLCGERKTLERIQYTLKTGKTLRN